MFFWIMCRTHGRTTSWHLELLLEPKIHLKDRQANHQAWTRTQGQVLQGAFLPIFRWGLTLTVTYMYKRKYESSLKSTNFAKMKEHITYNEIPKLEFLLVAYVLTTCRKRSIKGLILLFFLFCDWIHKPPLPTRKNLVNNSWLTLRVNT